MIMKTKVFRMYVISTKERGRNEQNPGDKVFVLLLSELLALHRDPSDFRSLHHRWTSVLSIMSLRLKRL